MTKHTNTKDCLKCGEILNRYPGFHKELEEWFIDFRAVNPDAHCAWAGRGKADQELFFKQGTSKAHYGQSSHNYNAAIDIFRITGTGAEWGTPWYQHTLPPSLKPWLNWYGSPGSKFREMPHVEVRDWKALVAQGLLKLVE